MKKWEYEIYLIGLMSLGEKELITVIGKNTKQKRTRDSAIKKAEQDKKKVACQQK